MRYRASLMVAVGLLLAAPAAAQQSAKPITFQEIKGATEFTGMLIARPLQPGHWRAEGLEPAEIAARAQRAAALMAGYQPKALNGYVPQTDEYVFYVPLGKTESQVATELMATGLFQYVHPNWRVYPVDCPNDPRLSLQWQHNANRMNSCAGWSIATGTPDIVVAICDTGVRTTHEDLQLHRMEGYNAVDQLWESQGGNIGPVHSHGTQTTGCAAANGNNGIGVTGTGWNLSHRMMRVSNDSSGGSSLDVLMHAARTAAETGDKIASVSYTGVNSDTIRTSGTYIKSLGSLLIYAADNFAQNHNWGDRDADDVLVVGATDQNDLKASFSSYGRSVDLTAPGVNVYMTDSASNSAYTTNSGTSFATPLTAGLAGVLWTYNPAMTPDEIEAALKAGCDDLGAAGIDDTFGYGRIDVEGALNNAVPPGGMYVAGASLHSEGQRGGPFTPDHADYLITNYDPAPIDFEVTTIDSWLDLSHTSGTLQPDESIAVTVTINDAANAFGNGEYNAAVQFANTTTHQGDRDFAVELVVGVPVSIYAWDFSTNPGWTTQGAWAFGQPTGNGGEYGNPDPSSGATGPNVYGYNLNGDYVNNMPEYHLTTTAIDCSDLTQTTLKFQRWLNVEQPAYDHAYVRVSNNGSTWTNVYSNGAEVTDASWTPVSFDISAIADGQSTVFLRWTMGSTDISWLYSGWNIDDVEIWGVAPECLGDFNADGSVNTLDVLDFLNAWSSGDPRGDFNADGDINTLDVLDFLNAWSTGC